MAKEKQKDQLQEIKNAIRSKQPGNLYFFHGEEVFLLRHYLGLMHKVILEELTESFNFHRFNNENFDINHFADAVENLPMMAERTLVQLEDIDPFKLPEDSRSKMADVLNDIPEYCTVIFVFETLEYKPDKRQKKLWEAVCAGEAVEFSKQSQRDLVNWISRHFAAKNKRITPELCLYLIELTDGTMTSIGSEIEKISAFSGAEMICKSDIDAVTEPVLDAVVYRMTDQLGTGEYGAALQTLQKLVKMQQDPLAILGAIGSHFRRLSVARTLSDHAKSYTELMKLYDIRADYAAKKAMDICRRFSPSFYDKAAEMVLETDYAIKTSFDDAIRLLEMLILRLAQEARRG